MPLIKLNELELISLDENNSVLINLMNGNADIVNAAVALAIRSGCFDGLDIDTLDLLIERGYVFDSEHARDKFVERIDKRLAWESTREIPNFIVVPTYSCNLDCYYCFERASISRGIRLNKEIELDVERFFSFVAKVLSEFENGYGDFDMSKVLVTITGGEPLQDFTFRTIEKLLIGCRNRGFRVSFVTNALAVPEYLHLLSDYVSVIDDMQITLDGAQREHDSIRVAIDGKPTFNRIVHSIELLSCLDLNLQVRINVTRRNVGTLTEIGPLIQKFDRVLFYVYLMQQEGRCQSENVLDELEGIKALDRLKDENGDLDNLLVEYHGRKLIESIFSGKKFHPKIKTCTAMCNQFIYDQFGYVYKCWWAMGNRSRAVGFDGDNGIAWNKKLLSYYRDRSVLKMDACRVCRYRYVCGGGCTGRLTLYDMRKGSVSCPDFHSILDYEVHRRCASRSDEGCC